MWIICDLWLIRLVRVHTRKHTELRFLISRCDLSGCLQPLAAVVSPQCDWPAYFLTLVSHSGEETAEPGHHSVSHAARWQGQRAQVLQFATLSSFRPVANDTTWNLTVMQICGTFCTSGLSTALTWFTLWLLFPQISADLAPHYKLNMSYLTTAVAAGRVRPPSRFNRGQQHHLVGGVWSPSVFCWASRDVFDTSMPFK